jgi:ATP-binding cassette subfamily B protein
VIVAVLARRKVPFVPQMEVAECGAACLAMVSEYFGRYVPLTTARALCGVSRDGVTALGIVKAARSLGFRVRAVKADMAGLRTLALPAILHWEFNHFLVLERIDRKRAVLIDPACGRRTASIDELDEKFTGAALTFEPSDTLEQVTRKEVSLARYFKVLGRSPRALGLVLGTACLLEIVATLTPAGTQLLIDQVLRPARTDWLLPLMAAIGIATLAQVTLTWLRDRAVQSLNFAIDLSQMVGFFDHLLSLPILFLEQRSTGDLMQRVRLNEKLRDLSVRLSTVMLDGLLVLGFGALMLAYDRQLGLLVLALALARMVLAQRLRSDAAERSACELSLRGRESTAAVQAVAAPEFIKAFRAESLTATRYINRLVQRLSATAHLRRVADRVMLGSHALDGVGSALVFWLGGTAVLEGRLSIGALTGFLALEGLLHAPLASLSRAFSDVAYARSMFACVDDVLETAPAPCGRTPPPDLARATIELDHVTFRYGPSGPPILDDLCLRVTPGEKIAIVGSSGAGKSTIARLMLGLLSPNAGVVRIGGIDVRELDRSLHLRALGVVLQDPTFFDDTVRNNLAMFDPEVSLAQLEHAAELACIHSTIESLPRAYDTPLGNNASRLSGGQRQRLALARALVREPKLLVLDEATSALDELTERAVHENLARLGCTRILIAHRLATVKDADRILVFHDGKFVQEGHYQELLAQAGPFADIARGLS